MRILYLKNRRKPDRLLDHMVASEFSAMLHEKRPELILTSGGDGTVLETFFEMEQQGFGDIPVMAKENGRVSFLGTNFVYEDASTQEAVHGRSLKALAKMPKPPHLFSFNPVEIWINGIKRGSAINDAIIGREINDFHCFEISSEDGFFEKFVFYGMGIGIATIIGSTGFNFNNGGRIVYEQDFWNVFSIVAQAHINDILRAQTITIRILDDRKPVYLYVDGSVQIEALHLHDEITLRRSQQKKHLSFLRKGEFLTKRKEYLHSIRKKM